MHNATQKSTPPNASRSILRHTAHLIGMASVATLLSGCGGGGGGDAPLQPPGAPTLSAAQLQGRWLTSSGITPARTAIVLSAAAGGTELWLLASDLSSLSRLQISTSGIDGISAAGNTYSLPSSSTNPGQSATFSGTANLSNNTLSLNAGALLLTRSDALTTPSVLADVVGNWSGGAGGQVVTLLWSAATNGTLSGSSSSGCSYSGTLSARSDASAFNASVTETCNSVSVSYAGIGTYRASPATLTLALTSTDVAQAKALVVGLSRP